MGCHEEDGLKYLSAVAAGGDGVRWLSFLPPHLYPFLAKLPLSSNWEAGLKERGRRTLPSFLIVDAGC